MCGIVGAVSTRNIVPILVQGLQRLEYRGYDSCGVAVHAGRRCSARAAPRASPTAGAGRGRARRRRHRHRPHALGHAWRAGRAQRASALQPRPGRRTPRPAARAAASRWCTTASSRTTTSCAPSSRPRATCSRARPTPRSSRTWSTACTTATCSRPCKARVPQLHGAYAIAVFCSDEPHRVVGARAGSPLMLGVGREGGENFLASDAMALAGVTDQIVYLEEGDVVDLQLGKYWIVRPAPTSRDAGAARGAHRARPQRRRRARALPPLHAKGDLRAAARRSPTRSRACRASCPSCSATAR